MKSLKIESGEGQVLRIPYDVMNAAAFIEARDVTILANGNRFLTKTALCGAGFSNAVAR